MTLVPDRTGLGRWWWLWCVGGVVRDVGGSWVGAARAVRAALGGEIAQETPCVDLEALVLH